MKYWTRNNGSQRPSAEYKVSVLETQSRDDGATHYPILWIRIEDKWHAIEFENEGEARVLMSCASHIHRSFQ